MSADVEMKRVSQGSQAAPDHDHDRGNDAAKDDAEACATHLPLPPFVDVTFSNAGTLLNGSDAVMATIHLHNLPTGYQVDMQAPELDRAGKPTLPLNQWIRHKSVWPLCISFEETPEVNAYLQKFSAEVAAVRDRTKCFTFSASEMVLAKYGGGGGVDGKKLVECACYKHYSISELVSDVVHVRHFQGKWQIFVSTGAASGSFGPAHLNVLQEGSTAKLGTDCVDVRVLMPARGFPILAIHDGEYQWAPTRRVAFDRLLPPKKRKRNTLRLHSSSSTTTTTNSNSNKRYQCSFCLFTSNVKAHAHGPHGGHTKACRRHLATVIDKLTFRASGLGGQRPSRGRR